jgi:K+-sensing histidine kinase KdpD
MNQVDRNQTLLQLQVSLPKRVILTVLIMAMLIMFVFFFNIPNPNMILIAGLVICSALFGYGGGVVAGVIMFFYTLFFFSTGHSFTEFTPENLQKVGVSLVGIAVDMVFVCALKRAEMHAFAQVDDLTEELNRENERLKAISMTDALTDIRNRMALRNDFDSYRGHEATVMMLDLDNFKQFESPFYA